MYVGVTPTLALADTPLQVMVNSVFLVIAVVVTELCTPSEGLTFVLKPLLPVMLHDAGGLFTVYLRVAVLPLRTRRGPEIVRVIGVMVAEEYRLRSLR